MRPAFYVLRPGGWRDYVTLLHPPYTLWHLSYIVLGAAIAPEWRPDRLGLTLGAFFLALGVGAHALDELKGRPLTTEIPRPVLVALAVASILGGAAVGVGAAVSFDLTLLPFVVFGGVAVVAYNLELFGGRVHTDLGFALLWGAFPVLTAYYTAAGRLRAEAFVGALFAALLSFAQRRLSTPVRDVRRRGALPEGPLFAAAESSLQALAAASIALAVCLVLLRAT